MILYDIVLLNNNVSEILEIFTIKNLPDLVWKFNRQN